MTHTSVTLHTEPHIRASGSTRRGPKRAAERSEAAAVAAATTPAMRGVTPVPLARAAASAEAPVRVERA